MERTLSIVKPDGVKKNVIGEVIKRFEQKGIRIAAAEDAQDVGRRCAGILYRPQGETFLRQPYRVHVGRARLW